MTCDAVFNTDFDDLTKHGWLLSLVQMHLHARGLQSLQTPNHFLYSPFAAKSHFKTMHRTYSTHRKTTAIKM